MTANRVISKSLAGRQDILFGNGQVTQTRAGGSYPINKVSMVWACATHAELLTLDTTQFTQATVNYQGAITNWGWTGSHWYCQETDLTLIGSFDTGFTYASANQVGCTATEIYSWGGAVPRVVAPGTDPIGVGFVDVSEKLLRIQKRRELERTLDSIIMDEVYVADYGAKGDGVTDDTVAFQAAFDAAKTLLASYFNPFPMLDGVNRVAVKLAKGKVYKIRPVTIGQCIDFDMSGAVVSPFDVATQYTHLFKLEGHSNVYNPLINMDFSLNHRCVFWLRGRYINVFSPRAYATNRIFTVGDPAWADDPASGALGDSEITIFGGYNKAGLAYMEVYGQNSIVDIVGAMVYTGNPSSGSLSSNDPRYPAWVAADKRTIVNCGALVYINGGTLANFNSNQTALYSKLQPVNTEGYVNRFGSFVVDGAHIEVNRLLSTEDSTYPAQDTNNLLAVSGANGYISAGATYYVDAGQSKQSIDIRQSRFHGAARTTFVKSISGGLCHVDYDVFADLGGTPRQMLYVSRPSGYRGFMLGRGVAVNGAFNSNLSTLSFSSVEMGEGSSDGLAQWFDISVGRLIARKRLHNLKVTVNLSFASGANTDATDVKLYVDEVAVPLATLPIHGGYGSVTFSLPTVANLVSVRVKVASYASRTLQSGSVLFEADV